MRREPKNRISSLPGRALVCLLLAGWVLTAYAQPAPRQAGRTSDSGGITSYDWALTPAGTVLDVGEVPLGAVLSPDGKWLAVLNCGQGMESVMLVSTATRTVQATADIPRPKAVFQGLAFSADGRTLYASGGPTDILRIFSVPDLKPADPEGVELRAEASQPPTVNPEEFAGKIVLPDPTQEKVCLYPISIALAPDQRHVWMVEALGNAIAIVDPVEHKVVRRIPVGTSGRRHTSASGARPR